MLTSLLSTKLFFPSLRPSLVPRPRLVERLEKGLSGPLTLISAPAGYGKTTLMSEWRAGVGSVFPVAWFSIDSGDNNPFRFWGYVTSALSALDSTLTGTAATLLQSPQFPPAEEFITSLLNTISGFTKDFALVLDDYHLITAPEIHQYLTYLVEHLPPQIHLVLLTRTDPSLPLARLRARGQLMELRAHDLRFTTEEAAHFLNTTMGLDLAAENIIALEQRTEGWIAGLQMAALSMQGKEDIHGFIKDFAGSHHYILDYLAEEVLGQQPEAIRTFLLRTSILDRMNGPLCDAVTGQQNGDQMLAELERRNLFIVPLDNERGWYRYHHLLTDLLLMRLKQVASPEELYLRASDWCTRQGFVEEAIFYALTAHDYARAAELIEANAWDWLNRGNVSTVLNWIAALPEEQITALPNLGVVLVWALFISGEEDQMVPRLQKIEACLTRQTSGEETLLRAIGARWRGNVEESFDLIKQAVGQLPESQSLLHGQAWFNRGMLYRESDVSKAQQAFGRSGAISEARKDIQGALKALYYEGTMFRLQGAMRRSEAVFRHALELANELPFYNAAGYARLGMAELTYEWNDLAETAKHLSEALKLALEKELDELHFNVALSMARIHRAHEEWLEAQKTLDEAEQLAHRAMQSVQMRIHRFLTIPILQEQVCLWIAQGNREQTLTALELLPAKENTPLSYQQMQQTTMARILIAQQKYAEALIILNKALKQAKRGRMAALSTMLLRSIALYANGEIEPALSDLEKTLAMAEPEGYIRVFLDEGKPMLDILRRAASKGVHPAYVRQILAAAAPADEWKRSAQPLIEPLSERELEILRLLAAGRSNQKIAEELFLATGTVKRHVSNIFGKMNVQSRTECIARARELGLLQ